MLQSVLRRPRGLMSVFLCRLSTALLLRSGFVSAQRDHYSTLMTMAVSGSTNFSVAFVTCPSMEVAKSLSRGLVGNRLAACVNIVPQVTSIYEWEGKVEEETEFLMIIKTQSARLSDLTSYVQTNHPYDVPEVISMKIEHGSEKYLAWLDQSTQKAT